ncbi:hypothetical protein BT96DRAFT_43819 [Gymnopus androsaceus JB14]|uniref:Uncharacterized protein n=1 Tax=Gymnopus androsaceus JB14 TaxID=1447944 RepID=A0A6A4HJZ9_9AGAR|nr:hypothetical protein BT96DRAFT_77377 [Gymnopus androsaceus JB14]KAE9398030.1 hypothetical protein BT96DRAFT_43819 [Gymnopus androsaceus JB14]
MSKFSHPVVLSFVAAFLRLLLIFPIRLAKFNVLCPAGHCIRISLIALGALQRCVTNSFVRKPFSSLLFFSVVPIVPSIQNHFPGRHCNGYGPNFDAKVFFSTEYLCSTNEGSNSAGDHFP